MRLEITKRIPIAAGMAGGSADAAAALRLAAEAAGLDDRRWLEDIAAGLGADVPSQVRGGLMLATGIGARLRPLEDRLEYSVARPAGQRRAARRPTSTPRPTASAWRATRSASPAR